MIHIVKASDMGTLTKMQSGETGADDPPSTPGAAKHWEVEKVERLEREVAKNMEEKPRKFLEGIMTHMAFRVDDIQGAMETLKQHNVKYFEFNHVARAGTNDFSHQMKYSQVFFYD